MGWAGGSQVANDIWGELRRLIAPRQRREAALIIVEALKGSDWDTLDESPLLIADSGGKPWTPYEENPICQCEHCAKEPATWFVAACGDLIDYQVCHNCVVHFENPRMI